MNIITVIDTNIGIQNSKTHNWPICVKKREI